MKELWQRKFKNNLTDALPLPSIPRRGTCCLERDRMFQAFIPGRKKRQEGKLTMKCYTCDVKMQPKALEGHEAWKCPICCSFMVDIHHLRSLCLINSELFEDLLNKIKSKTEKKAHKTGSYRNFSLDQKHHSMASISPPSGICPGCGTDLYPLNFASSKHSIQTHFCSSCENIQLQKKDLPGITGIFKNAKELKPVSFSKEEAKSFQLKDLIPVLDEQSLFIISAAFFMLFGISETYRTFILNIFSDMTIGGGIFIFSLIGAMVLSLYHAFSKKNKSGFEKLIFLFYTLTLYLLISGVICIYMTDHYTMPELLLVVFPGINFLAAIIASIFVNADSNFKIMESMVHDDDMPLRQLAFTAFFMFMFLFSLETLKINWLISISILMTFVVLKPSITTGSQALQKFFMSKQKQQSLNPHRKTSCWRHKKN